MILACLLPAIAESPFAGPQACAACHRAQYEKQTRSYHFQALRPIAESPIPDVPVPAPLLWAFGAGAQGVTPVGMLEDRYFEYRYSYYPAVRRFGLTFGHLANGTEPGILQSTRTITQCFNCHATGVMSGESGPNLADMRPGVTCERCHGPGRAHIAAAGKKPMLNPGRLAAKAQVQVCGECHRLPPPGLVSPEPELEDAISVRFAPIGLIASRCFSESNKLACTTCHDAHDNARARSDAGYTRACLSCHADAPANGSCRRAKRENCLPCHMRQASLGSYLKFTDHRIRVY
jgi:hypothetical protein